MNMFKKNKQMLKMMPLLLSDAFPVSILILGYKHPPLPPCKSYTPTCDKGRAL